MIYQILKSLTVKKVKYRFISTLFLALLLLTSTAQEDTRSASGAKATFTSTSTSNTLNSKSMRIGGISFSQIANPFEGLESKDITLNYHPEREDGQRLSIQVENSQDSVYFLNIPDWQLKPIAEFANTEDHVAITLVGDEKLHDAFQNTLLGTRLYQADLVYSNPSKVVDLFKNKEEEGVNLATSEIESGFSISDDELISLEANLAEATYLGYYNFSNYIVSDWKENIQFKFVNDKFTISGEPYYQFRNLEANWNAYQVKICDIINNDKYLSELGQMTEEDLVKLKSLCENDLQYSWVGQQIYDITKTLRYKSEYDYDSYIATVQNIILQAETEDNTKYASNEYFNSIKNLLKNDTMESVSIINELDFNVLYLNLDTSLYEYNYIKYGKEICDFAAFISNKPDLYQDLIKKDEFQNICETCKLLSTEKRGKDLQNYVVDLYYASIYNSDVVNSSDMIRVLKNIKSYERDSIISQLEKVELTKVNNSLSAELRNVVLGRDKVKILRGPTTQAKQNMYKVHEAVPAVIDACTQTMRYAAFFKYIKEQDAAQWAEFLEEVSKLAPIEDNGITTPSFLNN